jgi:glycosyltransferase involved in cell wall biosynthesis
MSATGPLSGKASPTVSIVIPAYNYARYLPQAIDSALQQSFPAHEILVIDDGSTDGTAQVVAQRYGGNPRVRYLHQPNAGLSSARNTGVKNAHGEFVAFLDADDYWKPDFLREVMARFARLSEDFAIVATRVTIVTVDGATLPRKQLLADTDYELTCADLLLKSRFSPSTAVVRRRVFAECGVFDTTLRSSEDRDMWIRIAARHRVWFCGQQLIFVRRHGSSMSTHADRMKTNTRRTLAKARQNPDIIGLPPLFWCRVNSFFRFQTAWMYFEEGRRAAALRDLFLSCLQWPWFRHPRQLNEPTGFRLRTLKHFLCANNPRRP